jgi:calcineurin-like phosphoesterase/protein-tyrosine-phosphatase
VGLEEGLAGVRLSWGRIFRNALMIGDIVGLGALTELVRRLPGLRRAYDVDVVANAENSAITAPTPWEGFGMTVELVERLLEGGVDIMSSGNHGWDGPEAGAVHRHPKVLRPHNVPEGVLGKGVATLDVEGELVSVVNLGSKIAAIPDALRVYRAWPDAGLRGTVIVDFHGDSVREKMEFATAVDGRVAAVLGTHTHEPTVNLHVLPGGTALVADVGMTGPSGSPGGFPLVHFAAEFKGEDSSSLPPFGLPAGPITLGVVLPTIEAGKTREIERVLDTVCSQPVAGARMRRTKTRVLFLCTHNSGRSQMAEVLLRHLAGDRFEVMRAGTEAKLVRPGATAVMAEPGMDISGHESKTLERYLGEPFDYVVTVRDAASEACPVFPGAKSRLHWSFRETPRGPRGTRRSVVSRCSG